MPQLSWPGTLGTGAGVNARATTDTARDADFEAWMSARQPALLRTADLLTGDTHSAEDLVQTTLAKLYLAWDRIRDREHVDAYARRALINEHRSTWRRPFKRLEVLAEHLPEKGVHDTSYDGDREALWRFVNTLPRRQRAVIVLRYYEELTEAETAQALGVSVGTVKSQASRALDSLRGRLPEHPELSRGEEDR
jgi:RNA polymerase sigma-70 factor (sigma-E family)